MTVMCPTSALKQLVHLSQPDIIYSKAHMKLPITHRPLEELGEALEGQAQE